MRRIILLIFSLLTVALSVVAQPRISSNKEKHHFGQVAWKHPVVVEYTITNTGNKPLVLSNVTTSCACSVAEWTKTPIAPGQKGTVQATFDAKALGRFNKSVGIYSNAQPSLMYLKFDGEVVGEVKDYTKTYPYAFGKILVDRNELDFPDVHRGEKPTVTIRVVNQSDRPYEPVLMHLPPYLLMEASPGTLLKGQKGVIKLTLDTKQLIDLGLTQASVYLARFAGDKVGEENEIPVSAVLLPDFSGMTEKEKVMPPAIQLSQSKIDLSPLLVKKSKASHDIIVTNVGKSLLKINKLQVFNPAVGVALKKSSLQPGESTRLRVTIHKNNLGKKKRHLRILMITNDPARPKVEIDVKANSGK